MTITFIYLMLFLKLPIVGLLWLVWWAIHQNPENDTDGADGDRRDGGSRVRRRHPRRPLPRSPRRGPPGCAIPPSPPRVRSVVTRVRRGTSRY